MSKFKNIIIFASIAAILITLYFFFFRGDSAETPLISVQTSSSTGTGSPANSLVPEDFLAVLLNVKGIKLDDSIFNSPVFLSLSDSSISLVQDGNEGRANPFAPLGFDTTAAPAAGQGVTPPASSTTSTGTQSAPNSSTTKPKTN